MNNIIEEYINNNTKFIKEKSLLMEEFRSNEDLLRTYEDVLGDLEKTKMSSQIDDFDNIKDRLSLYLMSFNPNDIEHNIKEVKSVIFFIKSKQKELNKLSETFNFVKKTWISFLTRRNPENIPSIFIDEVNDKINNLNESFFSAGINEIGRIEELAEDLKTEILKIINLFEDLYILLEKNIFIGEEAVSIKRDIEEFLNVDFYENSLLDLYKRKEDLSLTISPLLSKENNYTRKAVPVVKIENIHNPDIYYYTVKFGKYILEYENKTINDNDMVVETGKKIYIDNYPEKGIFKAEEIRDKISISKDQFHLMNDFDLYTGKAFWVLFSSFIATEILFLMNQIGIFFLLFLIIIYGGSFYLIYKKTLKYLEKKLKVENAFFFIPTNYFVLKEGDYHFNYSDFIYNILLNSDKTFLQDGE